MFLSDWRVLLRRWYVVLLGIQATVVLCYAATVFVPVKYQATADVLLLPPKATGKAAVTQGDNPFLELGGLDTVSGVLAKTLADRTTLLAVQKAGGTGTYTVVPDLTAGGPVLLVTVNDATAAGALRTLSAVTAIVPATLTDLQTTSGVGAGSLIRAKQITADTEAQPVRKSQMRAMLAAAAAGLGGTLLVTSLFDGFLARRAVRRKAGKADVAADEQVVAERPEPGHLPGPLPVEVRRPGTGEPVAWPPSAARGGPMGGTAGGALTGPPGGAIGLPAGAGARPGEAGQQGRPMLVPEADPDATMEIRDLDPSQLFGTDPELHAGDDAGQRGRRYRLDWSRRGSTG